MNTINITNDYCSHSLNQRKALSDVQIKLQQIRNKVFHVNSNNHQSSLKQKQIVKNNYSSNKTSLYQYEIIKRQKESYFKQINKQNNQNQNKYNANNNNNILIPSLRTSIKQVANLTLDKISKQTQTKRSDLKSQNQLCNLYKQNNHYRQPSKNAKRKEFKSVDNKQNTNYQYRIQNLDNLSSKIRFLLQSGVDLNKFPGKITTPRSNFQKMWNYKKIQNQSQRKNQQIHQKNINQLQISLKKNDEVFVESAVQEYQDGKLKKNEQNLQQIERDKITQTTFLLKNNNKYQNDYHRKRSQSRKNTQKINIINYRSPHAQYVHNNLTQILESNSRNIQETLKQLRNNRNKLKEMYNINFQDKQKSNKKYDKQKQVKLQVIPNHQQSYKPMINKQIQALKAERQKVHQSRKNSQPDNQKQKSLEKYKVIQNNKHSESVANQYNKYRLKSTQRQSQFSKYNSLAQKNQKLSNIQFQLTKQNDKKQVIKLAQVISKQAQIDQKMRPFRQRFCDSKQQQKWQKLKKQLDSKGVYLSIQQLTNELTMTSDEYNPFDNDLSQLQFSQCINKLSQEYEKGQKFWRSQFTGCVSIKRLERQGFTIKDIDLNKKGSLSVEDLVCFANLHTSNFFRNRDFLLLFRRFLKKLKNKPKKNQIQYETFLEVVTTA